MEIRKIKSVLGNDDFAGKFTLLFDNNDQFRGIITRYLDWGVSLYTDSGNAEDYETEGDFLVNFTDFSIVICDYEEFSNLCGQLLKTTTK